MQKKSFVLRNGGGRCNGTLFRGREFYGFTPIGGSTATDSEYSDSGSDSGSDSDSPSLKRVDPSSHYGSNDDEEYSGAEELSHEVTDIR